MCQNLFHNIGITCRLIYRLAYMTAIYSFLGDTLQTLLPITGGRITPLARGKYVTYC